MLIIQIYVSHFTSIVKKSLQSMTACWFPISCLHIVEEIKKSQPHFDPAEIWISGSEILFPSDWSQRFSFVFGEANYPSVHHILRISQAISIQDIDLKINRNICQYIEMCLFSSLQLCYNAQWPLTYKTCTVGFVLQITDWVMTVYRNVQRCAPVVSVHLIILLVRFSPSNWQK